MLNRVVLAVALVALPFSAFALQNCSYSQCTCPTYGDPARYCSETTFRCDAPTCTEVRGCPAPGSCVDPDETTTVCQSTCSTYPTCATSCGLLDFNPCCVEPTGPCQGTCGDGVSGPPVVAEPDRDPFHYGLLATEQLKLEDIIVHHESPDGSPTAQGPACHVGTNCNTTSENGPVGVMIVNQARFPAGTQVVVGKPKWRSKAGQRPAIADEIYANDWVEPGGDKVCNPTDSRQLWCYPPLLRNRYWGRCDPGPTTPGPTTTCADDPQGSAFCYCNQPCYIEAHWDETVGADQDPTTSDVLSVSNGEAKVVDACAIGDPQCTLPSCRIIASSSDLPIEPGVYSRIQVNDGVTAQFQPNGTSAFFVCTLRLNSNARVEFLPTTSDPVVTIFARDVSMDNGARFFWTDAGTFRWLPGWASATAIPPSNVQVGIFAAPGATPAPRFSLGRDVRLSGTFMAPQVDMALGTNSLLRGRFLAKTLIGQPKDFYCGCRSGGATCAQNSECCSGTCDGGSGSCLG